MGSKKIYGDYYLGLDIGTDSVGWAVTDPDYNILTFNGKAMWGVHLFDSGKTAKSRRVHRIARRMQERRKQRMGLLQSLFDEEMSKKDPTFFERMKESRFQEGDRKHGHHDTLFNDPNFKDKDLYRKYPTIYHLRKALMESPPDDIRLLYLACHHIIKHRGHFLFEGLSAESVPDFGVIFNENIVPAMNDIFEIDVPESIAPEISAVLTDASTGVMQKQKELMGIISNDGEDDGRLKEYVKLLSGGTAVLGKIFGDEDLKEEKLTFRNSDFEEDKIRLESLLDEDCLGLLFNTKMAYDSVIIKRLIGENGTISEAKVKQHEQHNRDLKLLKTVLRGNRHLYNEVLKSISTKNNYAAYVGVFRKKNDTDRPKSCSQAEFCKFLRGIMEDILKSPEFDNGELASMKKRIMGDEFMPKQVSKDNSMLPNALHQQELNRILEVSSESFSFLNRKDSDGITVKEKIISLCKFKIPYYVGPLNKSSERSWFERKEEGKILPWNFDKKVDMDLSAENFMNKLINKCTQIPTERVLPKQSILYQRFELYDEINKLSINGERISPKLKKDMIRDLFENRRSSKKLKIGDIENYLMQKGLLHSDDVISGIDIEIKSSLKSENMFKGILEFPRDREIADEIIRLITVYNGDRSRIKKKLSSEYKDRFTEDTIERISRLSFKDWGRLSEKLLTGIYATVNGMEMNILTAMEMTDLNLMELLSKDMGFKKEINKILDPKQSDGNILYELLDDLYVSPPVKRGIWRSMRIIQDILMITGHPPKKVFVETTREEREKKRTESRKSRLMRLYGSCKEQCAELRIGLEGTEESMLRRKDLYAYYTQQGRCMYCGKPIDLNDLYDNKMYDLDHVHPRSKKTDDSIHSNLVLVCRSHNQDKEDTYPLPTDVQEKMKPFWGFLKDKEFITKEKHDRLIRVHEFSEEELAGFINRQLVETSQTVNAVTKILERVFGDQTRVVYVKANNVSDFRNGNNGYRKANEDDKDLRFVKSRSVNDFHHAKDAYLNIVVGNAYSTKFTENPKNFLRTGEKYNLNLDRLLVNNIERNGTRAWTAGNDGTIATVQKYMKRNNILFTRFAYDVSGEFFNLMPLGKTKGQMRLKKDMPIEKYGGYKDIVGSYYALVEHIKGKKKVRTIQSIPVYMNGCSEEVLSEFMKDQIGSDDVRILIPRIRKFSMFEIDGFRTHISGRTGNDIVYYCAEQMILSEKDYDYCKKLEKYITASKGIKDIVPAKDFHLTMEENISLYDALTEKYSNKKYSTMFKSLAEKLEEKRIDFARLTLEDQSKLLESILHAAQCSPIYVNLEKVNGPKLTGRIQKNNNVLNLDSIRIINQSPTGLFERKTPDLKDI